MNIDNLKRVATQGLGRGTLLAKKFSPEVLTVAGVVGLVTAGVLASRATLKLETTVDKAQLRLQEAKAKAEVVNPETNQREHTDGELRKYMAKAHTANVLDVVKLYTPAATLALTSTVFIIGAQGIMRKRNVAIVAAYKATEEAFAEYRKRVSEELGEDKERDIRLGIREEEVDIDGVTKVVTHIDPNAQSQYARIFDESNPNWQRQAEYNLLFVKGVQNMMNDLLIARGHVTLNDVYDALGIPRSQAGHVVGWIISKDGDNYIDFNIYDFSNEAKRRFVNGDERSIWLDFNVDGVIYDKI